MAQRDEENKRVSKGKGWRVEIVNHMTYGPTIVNHMSYGPTIVNHMTYGPTIVNHMTYGPRWVWRSAHSAASGP